MSDEKEVVEIQHYMDGLTGEAEQIFGIDAAINKHEVMLAFSSDYNQLEREADTYQAFAENKIYENQNNTEYTDEDKYQASLPYVEYITELKNALTELKDSFKEVCDTYFHQDKDDNGITYKPPTLENVKAGCEKLDEIMDKFQDTRAGLDASINDNYGIDIKQEVKDFISETVGDMRNDQVEFLSFSDEAVDKETAEKAVSEDSLVENNAEHVDPMENIEEKNLNPAIAVEHPKEPWVITDRFGIDINGNVHPGNMDPEIKAFFADTTNDDKNVVDEFYGATFYDKNTPDHQGINAIVENVDITMRMALIHEGREMEDKDPRVLNRSPFSKQYHLDSEERNTLKTFFALEARYVGNDAARMVDTPDSVKHTIERYGMDQKESDVDVKETVSQTIEETQNTRHSTVDEIISNAKATVRDGAIFHEDGVNIIGIQEGKSGVSAEIECNGRREKLLDPDALSIRQDPLKPRVAVPLEIRDAVSSLNAATLDYVKYGGLEKKVEMLEKRYDFCKMAVDNGVSIYGGRMQNIEKDAKIELNQAKTELEYRDVLKDVENVKISADGIGRDKSPMLVINNTEQKISIPLWNKESAIEKDPATGKESSPSNAVNLAVDERNHAVVDYVKDPTDENKIAMLEKEVAVRGIAKEENVIIHGADISIDTGKYEADLAAAKIEKDNPDVKADIEKTGSGNYASYSIDIKNFDGESAGRYWNPETMVSKEANTDKEKSISSNMREAVDQRNEALIEYAKNPSFEAKNNLMEKDIFARETAVKESILMDGKQLSTQFEVKDLKIEKWKNEVEHRNPGISVEKDANSKTGALTIKDEQSGRAGTLINRDSIYNKTSATQDGAVDTAKQLSSDRNDALEKYVKTGDTKDLIKFESTDRSLSKYCKDMDISINGSVPKEVAPDIAKIREAALEKGYNFDIGTGKNERGKEYVVINKEGRSATIWEEDSLSVKNVSGEAKVQPSDEAKKQLALRNDAAMKYVQTGSRKDANSYKKVQEKAVNELVARRTSVNGVNLVSPNGSSGKPGKNFLLVSVSVTAILSGLMAVGGGLTLPCFAVALGVGTIMGGYGALVTKLTGGKTSSNSYIDPVAGQQTMTASSLLSSSSGSTHGTGMFALGLMAVGVAASTLLIPGANVSAAGALIRASAVANPVIANNLNVVLSGAAGGAILKGMLSIYRGLYSDKIDKEDKVDKADEEGSSDVTIENEKDLEKKDDNVEETGDKPDNAETTKDDKQNDVDNSKDTDTDDTEVPEDEEPDDTEVPEDEEPDDTEVPEDEESDDTEVPEDEEPDDTEVPEDEEPDDTEVPEDEESDDTEIPEDEEPDDTEVTEDKEPDDTEVTEDEESDDTEVTEDEEPDDTEVTEDEEPDDTEVPEDEEPDDTEIPEDEEPDDTEIPEDEEPDDTEIPEDEEPDDTEIPEDEEPDDTEIPEDEEPDDTEIPEDEEPDDTEIPEDDEPDDTEIPEDDEPDDTEIPEDEEPDDTEIPEDDEPDDTEIPEDEEPDDTEIPEDDEPDDTEIPEDEEPDDTEVSEDNQTEVKGQWENESKPGKDDLSDLLVGMNTPVENAKNDEKGPKEADPVNIGNPETGTYVTDNGMDLSGEESKIDINVNQGDVPVATDDFHDREMSVKDYVEQGESKDESDKNIPDLMDAFQNAFSDFLTDNIDTPEMSFGDFLDSSLTFSIGNDQIDTLSTLDAIVQMSMDGDHPEEIMKETVGDIISNLGDMSDNTLSAFADVVTEVCGIEYVLDPDSFNFMDSVESMVSTHIETNADSMFDQIANNIDDLSYMDQMDAEHNMPELDFGKMADLATDLDQDSLTDALSLLESNNMIDLDNGMSALDNEMDRLMETASVKDDNQDKVDFKISDPSDNDSYKRSVDNENESGDSPTRIDNDDGDWNNVDYKDDYNDIDNQRRQD